MSIETETPNHEPIEIPNQKIRQIEGSQFFLMEPIKNAGTREKCVAVRAGKTPNPSLAEELVELSAGAAISVRHENLGVLALGFFQTTSHGPGNFLRAVVELRRKPFGLQMGPTVELDQRRHFSGQCRAADQENGQTRFHHGDRQRAAARLATSSLAVSTAVAASRQ